jgi:hypothetical protein
VAHAQSTSATLEPPLPSLSRLRLRPRNPAPRILLVDDEPKIRDFAAGR